MTIEEFQLALQAKLNMHYARSFKHVPAPIISVEFGKRYARIVRNDGYDHRSVYGFIDTETGDLLKADGWKRPAKHARGNLADADPLAACTPWGMAYLR